MATVVRRPGKNGQVSYRVEVRRKGAPPQSASFQTLAEVRKRTKIREGALLEGRHFTSTAARRHTVSDLIDRYLNDVLPSKRPSTAYNQRYRLQWWKAQLGHYALADVTSALLIECRDKLTRNKARRQSGATVKRWLAVLSHCFTMAVCECQWCDENPVRTISKPNHSRYCGAIGYACIMSVQSSHQYLSCMECSINAPGKACPPARRENWDGVDHHRANTWQSLVEAARPITWCTTGVNCRSISRR